MKPEIATIIITYNAMPWIEKCLKSIQNSSLSSHVYIRDNGSTDGTQEYIQSHFTEVRFSQSVENLGFGKANNLEIESAYKEGAEYFFLLNQDTYLFPDTLEKLMKVAQNNPEFGIISPIHLAGDEKTLDFGFRNYIRRTTVANHYLSDIMVDANTTQELYQLDFINAAAWLLPKHTIEKVGGFNPLFFHYGEDREYMNRVAFHELKAGFVPHCYMVHDRIQKDKKLKGQNTPVTRSLIILLNPNDSYTFYKSVIDEIKSILKHLIGLNFNEISINSNVLFFLFKNRKLIKEQKKEIKKKAPTFL